ncbi:hypothetical protein [Pelosinus sp. IPA-1]|uniref:hypothetical protein n=1 Tax=Pelosinus sp. IPA-1 TaxID=3029569 RepID=UPI0024361946|nr:hypothetical protein [Pelosinus sp. IPA-1]GMB02136.1 hypothetical protein PIPA1_49360 [Pelosinus sp. IPA-1]
MTDRELLEVILEKITSSEARIITVESKLDGFITDYKNIVYGFGRDEKDESK